MSHVVTLAGSPFASASSSALLQVTHRALRRRCVHADAIIVRDLPCEDLIHGRLDSSAVQTAYALLDQAEGVIIATPVYKAAYAGVLKTFLDLLPHNALHGKTVLPIVTGGSPAQFLALEYVLKPVLSALGACHILRGVYVVEKQIQFEHGGILRLDEDVEQHLQSALDELVCSVRRPFAWEPELLLEGFER